MLRLNAVEMLFVMLAKSFKGQSLKKAYNILRLRDLLKKCFIHFYVFIACFDFFFQTHYNLFNFFFHIPFLAAL